MQRQLGIHKSVSLSLFQLSFTPITAMVITLDFFLLCLNVSTSNPLVHRNFLPRRHTLWPRYNPTEASEFDYVIVRRERCTLGARAAGLLFIERSGNLATTTWSASVDETMGTMSHALAAFLEIAWDFQWWGSFAFIRYTLKLPACMYKLLSLLKFYRSVQTYFHS